MAGGCYLFPYESVKPKSKIVIFGAGNVGTSYVRQMIATDYCHITAWVDSNYSKKGNRYLEVKSVDTIKNLTYDYLIIAVDLTKDAFQMKRQLLRMGVWEEKIIYGENRYFPFEESEITFHDILMDNSLLRVLIEEFRKRHTRMLDYFFDIIRCYQEAEPEEKELFVLRVKDFLRYSTLNEEKFIIFRILFRLNYFDEECMRCAVDTAKELEDGTQKYWMLVHIGLFEFMNPDSIYDEFYFDKRTLYLEIAELLMKDRVIQVKSQKRDSRKLVILAQYLHAEEESLTKFISMYANELAAQGEEVHIVLCEPFLYYYGEAEIIPNAATTKTSKDYLEDIEKYLDKKVIIHFSRHAPIEERFYESVKEVIDVNPYAVLDMTAKHSFLSAEVYKYFPVICVSTGNNCNASLFHKYICRGKKQCRQLNSKYHSVLPEQMVELPVGTVFPKPKYIYRREQYGLDEQDFILVSVGRRLYVELTAELTEEVTELLKKYHNMKWMIVGEEIAHLKQQYPERVDNGQIIFWGFEKDLPSLYRICNVFVNPNRIGGGWSVTWAIGEGLPVAATDFPCDSTPILGELVTQGDYHDLVLHIEKMYLDKDYYDKCVSKTIQRRQECSFSRRIEKLIELCDKISDER